MTMIGLFHAFAAAVSFPLLHSLLWIPISTCSTGIDSPWGVTTNMVFGSHEAWSMLQKSILDRAERDCQQLATRITPLRLEYSIFRGHSALRSLFKEDERLAHSERLTKNATSASSHRMCALLLLSRGYADAAHEMILGVTTENMEEAEYAATHRGETNWTQEHPLSDTDDYIHSMIHRYEASSVGEGNYSGFQNAKYWLAGGPKFLSQPANHDIRRELAHFAQVHAPNCISKGLVSKNGTSHTIIANGGKTRQVYVAQGEWDGFCWIDLCERRGEVSKQQADELCMLQQAEFLLLLRHELQECCSQTDDCVK